MALMLYALQQRRAAMRRERLFRDRLNPFEQFDELEFISRYRLPKNLAIDLCDSLRVYLEHPTRRNCSLPTSLQICTALRFYATGSYQTVIGDLHGLSQPTVSRCIRSVSEGLVHNRQRYISFPINDVNYMRNVKNEFHEIARFPNVIGAVDGTLVAIRAPANNEGIYVCRKGFHAINVQIVMEANMKITNIVARWPGSTHDSFIWQNCTLEQLLSTQPGNGWLLGDSGYAIKPYPLTPHNNPDTVAKEHYNRCHCATRCLVERGIGVWKMRFRCLHRGAGALQMPPERCCNVIVACACIHNICVTNNLPLPNVDAQDFVNNDVNPAVNPIDIEQNNTGVDVRNNLVLHRFS